ncbi:MAG: site-specific tyrosine recombinase XerC [bacterium]|nr:site-specific tyrosine recombinase XerC [bacterium]
MVHDIIPDHPADLAAEVLRHLQWMRQRNYTERTVYEREGRLGDLVAWCSERGVTSPQELTHTVIELYQKHLTTRRKPDGSGTMPQTQSHILSIVRTFCSWLVRQHLVLYNPAAELELPRTPSKIPRDILSPSEVEQILTLPDLSTAVGLKDRALLETLYSTGIRRAELSHLEIGDIDFDRGSLLVREGKNRKDRLIPIGDRALRWVAKYLADGRPNLVVPPDDGVLFLTSYGKPYQPNGISELVTRLIRASGVGKKGSAHLFRHSMATAMLEGGADIRFIQEMLGHSTLKTTEIYTKVSVRALKKVHDATHPAAKMKRVEGPRFLLDDDADLDDHPPN